MLRKTGFAADHLKHVSKDLVPGLYNHADLSRPCALANLVPEAETARSLLECRGGIIDDIDRKWIKGLRGLHRLRQFAIFRFGFAVFSIIEPENIEAPADCSVGAQDARKTQPSASTLTPDALNRGEGRGVRYVFRLRGALHRGR